METNKNGFYRMIFTLMLPMIIQNLINVAVSSADVVMLEKVGETVLAASSLAGQVQFVLMLILFGLTSGAAILTSQYWGKGDTKTIEKILGMSLRTSFLIALFFVIIIWAFPFKVMGIFTSEQDVINEGVKYVKIVSISYLFLSISMVYLNISRSVEKVYVATFIYFNSFIINIILNYILIFGKLGFEPMGIRGAAIATLISRVFEFFIVLFHSAKINDVIKIKLRNIFSVKDKVIFNDFVKYSFPVTINELLWGTGTAANAAIIGHLGKAAASANSISQITRQLATVIGFGIASSTSIIIGKTIGEKDYENAKKYSKKCIYLCLCAGFIGTLSVLAIRFFAIDFFNLSDTSKSYMSSMMLVMSYFVFCQAINATLIVGLFRAGGDVKFALIIDLTTLWGCAILIGFLAAFVFKLSVPIVYIILMSDEVIKIPFVIAKYKKMTWLNNVTREL